MSPELERLLEAYHDTLTGTPDEAAKSAATFEGLLRVVFARQPGTSREAMMEALQLRYREFRRARRKPPTIPPKA